MSILVVGSVAMDDVTTPAGSREGVIGGSASYFSVAASYFGSVHMVGTVGHDFPQSALDTFSLRGIDLAGLQQQSSGKTFRWKGSYDAQDLNEAQTHVTALNVFATFDPVIPEHYQHTNFVFLGNIDPELQLKVLEQVQSEAFVACDTMKYWIEGKLEALKELLKRVDLLTINEAEAQLLSGEMNVLRAARKICAMGPKYLIIKRGAYGALLFLGDDVFYVPAFLLEEVVDPTGAGDAFAGGVIGYLSSCEQVTPVELKKGMVYGTALASYNVSAFSFEGILALTDAEIEQRYKELRHMVGIQGDIDA